MGERTTFAIKGNNTALKIVLGVMGSLLVGLILFMLGGARHVVTRMEGEHAALRSKDETLATKDASQDKMISDIQVSLSRVETDVSWIRKKLEREGP
jgi:hypothetical protein